MKQEQEKLEREHRLYQEQQRHLREQAERERQAALAAKEEAERARITFEREERERRLREKEDQKHQEEERRTKREREQREKRERDELEKRSQHSSTWLGKRAHQDSGSSGSGYPSVKRQALHGSSDNYGTVFSRLDPQTQQKKVESNIQPLMSTHVDSFRRASDHRSGHSSGNVYAKAMSGGLQQSIRSTPSTDLSPELLSAATQALENLRKSVHGVGGIGTQLSLPKPMPHLNVMSAHTQLQQLAASNASAALSAASGASRIPVSSMLPSMNPRSSLEMHHQGGSMLRQPVIGNQGSGGGGINSAAFAGLHGKASPHYGAGGVTKLPPEEERYNRRFGGRSSHHQSGGRPGYKGRMN